MSEQITNTEIPEIDDSFLRDKLLERIIQLKKRLDKLVFVLIITTVFAYINQCSFEPKDVLVLTITHDWSYHLAISIILLIVFAMTGSHLIEYVTKRSKLDMILSDKPAFYKNYKTQDHNKNQILKEEVVSKTIIPSSFYEYMYMLDIKNKDPLRNIATLALLSTFFASHLMMCIHLIELTGIYINLFTSFDLKQLLSSEAIWSLGLIIAFMTVIVLCYSEFLKSNDREKKGLGPVLKNQILIILGLFSIVGIPYTLYKLIKKKHLFKIAAFIACKILRSDSYCNAFKRYPATNNDYKKEGFELIKASSIPRPFKRNLDSRLKNILLSHEGYQISFSEFFTNTNTDALLVLKKDKLILEHYKEGVLESSPLMVWSVTKAYLTTLVGIALHEKKLEAIHLKISDFLPADLLDNINPEITIHHLLDMTSGIKNKDFFKYTPYLEVHYGSDLYNYTKNAYSEHTPGEHFHYSQIDPIFLTLIMRNLYEKSVKDLIQEKIYEPLGMQYDAYIGVDKNGYERMASGLFPTAIDIAKLSRLYINKGVIDNRRLFSEDWANQCSKSKHSLSKFWRHSNSTIHSDQYIPGASGHKLLYIVPEHELTVLRFGDGMTSNKLKETLSKYAEDIIALDSL